MKTFLVFFLIFMSSSLFAHTLKVASGEYAPYSGEHIDRQGISSQVVKAVFKEMKQDVKLEFMPWKRVRLLNDNNSVAGSFPWNMNEERKKLNYFSAPIHQYKVLAFTKKGNDFNTEKSLKGKNLCVTNGWDSTAYKQLIEKLELQVVSPINVESCFNMLMMKRVDIVFMNELVGREVNFKLFGKNSEIIGSEKAFFQKRVNLYYMISKTYPGALQIITDFNQGLEKIKHNGVYESIVGLKSSCESCNRLGSL